MADQAGASLSQLRLIHAGTNVVSAGIVHARDLIGIRFALEHSQTREGIRNGLSLFCRGRLIVLELLDSRTDRRMGGPDQDRQAGTIRLENGFLVGPPPTICRTHSLAPKGFLNVS